MSESGELVHTPSGKCLDDDQNNEDSVQVGIKSQIRIEYLAIIHAHHNHLFWINKTKTYIARCHDFDNGTALRNHCAIVY